MNLRATTKPPGGLTTFGALRVGYSFVGGRCCHRWGLGASDLVLLLETWGIATGNLWLAERAELAGPRND